MKLTEFLKITINPPTKKAWVYALKMVLWTILVGLTMGFFLAFGDYAVYIALIPVFFIFRELVRNYNLLLLSLIKNENDEV